MRKSFDWQQFTVPKLRSVVRRLRRRAIMFKFHHFNTRQTKQDLVQLLHSLFECVGSRDPGLPGSPSFKIWVVSLNWSKVKAFRLNFSFCFRNSIAAFSSSVICPIISLWIKPTVIFFDRVGFSQDKKKIPAKIIRQHIPCFKKNPGIIIGLFCQALETQYALMDWELINCRVRIFFSRI